jgi:hypothetical protein
MRCYREGGPVFSDTPICSAHLIEPGRRMGQQRFGVVDSTEMSRETQAIMKIAGNAPALVLLSLLLSIFPACAQSGKGAQSASSPQGPFTDYRYEKPGTVHKIMPADLPAPYATSSASNWVRIVDRPKNSWPQAPAGFKVEFSAESPPTESRNKRRSSPAVSIDLTESLFIPRDRIRIMSMLVIPTAWCGFPITTVT